jgi:hypothetical protein
MNPWLDTALVAFAVLVSTGYVIYALGTKRIKAAYSRWVTKHLGLWAARFFSRPGCDNCGPVKPPPSERKPR